MSAISSSSAGAPLKKSTPPPVFSVGHSNHQPEQFLALLQKHKINRLIDVRSSPASHRFPQYNMENLKALVETAGIEYNHQKILGGREKGGDVVFRLQSDPNVSQALFKVINRQDLMSSQQATNGEVQDKNEIKKTDNDNNNFHCALMCSEGNWHDCHRQNLIHYLVNQAGVQCLHIWPDGKLEEHKKGETAVRLTQKDEETAKLVEQMKDSTTSCCGPTKNGDEKKNDDDDQQQKQPQTQPQLQSKASSSASGKRKKNRLQ